MPPRPPGRPLLLSALAALAALAGCGDDSTSLPDASDPQRDAPAVADAGPPGLDGASGVVSVQLAPPVGEVPVLFLAADDTVVAMTTTDGAGMASATLPPGGSVTVINQALEELYTVLGVEAGDTIRVPIRANSSAVTITVDLPVLAGATSYQVRTSCSNGGTSNTPQVLLLSRCSGPTDVLVVAQTPTGPQALLAPDVDLPAVAGVVTVTGTYRPEGSASLTVTNVPAGLVTVDAHLVRARGRFFINDQVPTAAAVTAGAAAVPALPYTDLPGLDVLAGVIMQPPGVGRQHLVRRGPAAASYTLDAGVTPLPFVQGVSVDDATQTVTWTGTGPGTPVAVWTQLQDGKVYWNVLAPSGTPVRMPHLPAPFDVYQLIQGRVLELALLAGATYPALRAEVVGASNVDQLVLPGSTMTIALQP